jgi:hypothetical protein
LLSLKIETGVGDGGPVEQVGTCLAHGLQSSLPPAVASCTQRKEDSKVNAVVAIMVVYILPSDFEN